MKSLKKTLSLALVFVMAFGLMISATAMTDSADVNYTEQVEVMTGIGAIAGFPDGSFQPDGLVTRAQAAKMIAYAALTPDVAKNLSATGAAFSDVPASFWGAPFIEYCFTKGIVSGVGGGKFDPNGNVTTYQLAKMMLIAIGYGKNSEYVGGSWLVNVVVDATDKDLFVGLADDNKADAATREEAALIIFNGVTKAKMVNFNETIKDYQPTAANKTIGELKYGLIDVTTTENGVTGYTWKNSAGKALSSFIVDENVLGTSTDGTTIAKLSTKTEKKFVAELDSVVTYVINGTIIPEYVDGAAYAVGKVISYKGVLYNVTIALTAAEDNTDLATNASLYTIGKGVVVKLINSDTDAKVEKIALTIKTVGQVGAVPSVNPTTGAVTISGLTGSPYAKDTVIYPADLAKDDFVLIYKDDLNVYHIEKAALVTGKMTSANTVDKSIVFAGATYAESGLVAANSVVPAFYGTASNFNADAKAYLDDNSNIVALVKVGTSGPAAQYGLVVDYKFTAATAGTFGTAASAKVLLYTEDGAVAVYNVAKDSTGVVPSQVSAFNFATVDDAATPAIDESVHAWGYLVKYSINANGEATLTAVGTGDTLSAKYDEKSTTLGLTTLAKNVYITSATKVIYFDDTAAYNKTTNVAKFVTGFSNTSDAAAAKNATYILKSGTNNVDIIFIGNAPASITVPGNYAYVQKVNVSTRYEGSTALYDYVVYVNGVKTTLTSKTGTYFTATGLYKYSVDSNGYVIATPAVPTLETAVTGGNVAYVDAGFVAYADAAVNKSVAVTSATKYYQVTDTGVVEAALAASSTYTTYSIKYITTNTDGDAVAIYFAIS